MSSDEKWLQFICQLFEHVFEFKNVCLEFINWEEENSANLNLFDVSLLIYIIERNGPDISILGLRILVSIMKSIPLTKNLVLNVEEINQNSLFLSEYAIFLLLRPLLRGLAIDEFKAKKFSMDILTAFVGELEDHLTTAPVLDIRMENIVERKTRIEFLRGFKKIWL